MKTLPLFVLLSSTLVGHAAISYTGTTIVQNFNSLASSGLDITFTDNVTLPGWTAYSGDSGYPGTGIFTFSLGTATSAADAYDADPGSSTTGELYSYGSTGSTERALGSLASGTAGDFFLAVQINNDTGADLSSFDVSYRGEQWRRGANTTQRAESILFFYRIGGAAFDATGTWIAVPALNFVSPNATLTTGAALDGNASGNSTSLSSSITTTVPAGSSIWLAWVDPDNTGTDHGMAIDDFSFSAVQVPEPSSLLLGLLALAVPLRRNR